MSFDAGALIFKIQTAGYQTFAQQMDEADRKVQGVGKAGAEAVPKVEKTTKATEELGKKSQSTKKPLDELAESTKKTGDESAKAAPKQEKQAAASEQQAAAAQKLATGLMLAGTAVAALVGMSVARYASFDQAMSNVRAATMATAEEQKTLGESALQAGADTAYSATEAAAAQEELAKAGMSVSQVVGGGLNGALALAAAGQLQVARSAEIMATTLTQFGLTADKAGHVADVLAAGAGKAQGSVDDLALALTYVGPLANAAGWSLEETGGTLAYFASQGILGEKAGTSLRGVLAALQAPSTVASKVMDQYGISLYDANGQMVSASEMAARLQGALGGLTQEERNSALGRIFGNESLVAANLLYKGGADAVNEWTAEVNDANYATEQASIRQDNLAGDVEKLGGAFETALIRSGSGANDVLREMVQAVTSLVDWWGELPEPVHQVGLVLGVATAAIGLFAGGAVIARAKVAELKTQLDLANVSMGKTALVGAAAGLALTGVITVVALLASAQAEARAKAEAYADALGNGADAARELATANLQADKTLLWVNFGNAYDYAKRLGISLDTVTDAALGQSQAMTDLNRILAVATGGGDKAREMADRLGISQLELAQAAGTLRDQVDAERSAQERATELRDQATRATERNEESVVSAAEAYTAAADETANLNDQLSKLIDRINEANGVGQDAVTANARWQEALAGIADEIEETGTSLDESTVAGSANASMLADVAGRAQDAAEKQLALDQQTMSAKDATDKYVETLAAQRKAFIDAAIEAEFGADQVQALADKVFALPDEKAVSIIAETAVAQAQIDQFISAQDARTIRIGITTYREQSGGEWSFSNGPGTMAGYADGAVLTPRQVSFHATGSVSEHHVAQIARAGAMRVWAEPETGGESYVPHHPSKRARSEQIMAETAAILGGQYIPSGAYDGGGGATVNAPITINGGGLSGGEVRAIVREEVRSVFGSALGGA